MTTPRASGVRRLATLFDRSAEPAFLLGPRGELAYANPAWTELVGAEAGAALGLDPAATDALAPFRATAESLAGVPSSALGLIVRPDGERVWMRIEHWPFRDDQGQPLGLLGFARASGAPPLAAESPSRKLRAELDEAREALRARFGHVALVGRGPRHARLLAQVSAASRTISPVVVVGEPGTGRRTVARLIHDQGPAPRAPFLVLDLPALGKSEHATFPDGSGTVVLLDPERLPRDVQARLAPSLAAGSPRWIAATAVDPEVASRDGRFRDDFYFGADHAGHPARPPARAARRAPDPRGPVPRTRQPSRSPRGPPSSRPRRSRPSPGTTGRETSRSWRGSSTRPTPAPPALWSPPPTSRPRFKGRWARPMRPPRCRPTRCPWTAGSASWSDG